MLKMVVSDYIQSWKGAWKNLAKEGWFGYLYFIAFPLVTDMKARQSMVYLCAVIPMVLGILLSRLYPNRIHKTLFLCPMSKEDRITYFKTAFRLRVSLPLILFLIVNSVLFIKDYISPLYLIIEFIILFLYVVSVNIYWCYWSTDGKRNIYSEKNHLSGTFFIWDLFSQIGVFNMLIITSMSVSSRFDYIIVGICLGLQFFVFFKLVTRYYKKVMDLSVNYEAGYGKKDK